VFENPVGSKVKSISGIGRIQRLELLHEAHLANAQGLAFDLVILCSLLGRKKHSDVESVLHPR
jgi:hypothetical protein